MRRRVRSQAATGTAGRQPFAFWEDADRFWTVVGILLSVGAAAALLLLVMVGT